MDEIAIKIDNVTKEYRLGAIGGGTLREDLQSWWARKRGKEDPNSKIGSSQTQFTKGDRFLALNGVSFDVKKGERVGIIGHNGAGKSTLLKLLSRVTAPTSGMISYNGRITSMLEVGTGFHGELTGRENIYMNGAILGMTKKEIDEKIEDIIDFSECRQFIDTPVKRYSSGMYVKLAFSVAAHLDSEIMIMDEVLAVGDMAFQKKCLDKMNDVSRKEGRTILYVSHNMNTIRQLCDRVVVLDHGKVVFDGDVEEGIARYIGYKKLPDHIVFGPEDHHNKSVGYVSIKSIDIPDNIPIVSGNSLNFSIYVDSQQLIENARFRFETRNQNTDIIGTFFSDNGVNIDVGFNRFDFELDTSHIMNGTYTCDIVIFIKRENNEEYYLDGVYPGMSFEISPLFSNENHTVWKSKCWGNIRFHNVKVIKNEKI